MLGKEPTTMKRCTNCRLSRYCSAVRYTTPFPRGYSTRLINFNQKQAQGRAGLTPQKCQREDWTPHKPECAAHKALRALFVREHPGVDPEVDLRWIMSESVRALGRLCWARQRGRVGQKDPDWVGDVCVFALLHTDQSGKQWLTWNTVSITVAEEMA
jgi:hypothetical protein